MKFNSSEATTARLAFAVLESKLLDLVKHEKFNEILQAFRGQQQESNKLSAVTIVTLFETAAALARDELGMPQPASVEIVSR